MSSKPVKGTCTFCGKTMLKTNLSAHFKICTGKRAEKPFWCKHEGCTSKFATYAHLRGHEVRHHDSELSDITCPYQNCEATVSPGQGLIRHIKDYHEKRKNSRTYECPKCKKVVRDIYYHLRDTCSDRMIGCSYPMCDAVFKTSRGKAKHEAAHHEPPKRCEYENCQYVGRHLGAHVSYVHKRSDLICDTCGKVIKYSSFKVHRDSCADRGSGKIYRCIYEDCRRVFLSETQKKLHLWRCHKPPMECPYENCKAVLSHGYVSQHVNLFHSVK